ncbi:hypothetical protein OPT61_g8913 [Boeremia exigua]|uniref:Uncharacterized protein n=1 Tax=Boeremia exigua TaxID=749465 RepID=A0ACC2HW87_9PLEO|nr:hypothetical protein OPT61_g8913 [Boeremia exigua]
MDTSEHHASLTGLKQCTHPPHRGTMLPTMAALQIPPARDSLVSRLDALPTEILRRISEYVMPQGLVFSFQQRRTSKTSKDLSWRFYAAEPGHEPNKVYDTKSLVKKCKRCDGYYLKENFQAEMQLSLLYVNKTISTEARGKHPP